MKTLAVLCLVLGVLSCVTLAQTYTASVDGAAPDVLGNCTAINSDLTRGLVAAFTDKTLLSTFLGFSFACGLRSRSPDVYACISRKPASWSSIPVKLGSGNSVEFSSGCVSSDTSLFHCAVRVNMSSVSTLSAEFDFADECFGNATAPTQNAVWQVGEGAFHVRDVNAPTYQFMGPVSITSPSSSVPIFKSMNLTLAAQASWSMYTCNSPQGQRPLRHAIVLSNSGTWIADLITSGFTCAPMDDENGNLFACSLSSSDIEGDAETLMFDLSPFDDKSANAAFAYSAACFPSDVFSGSLADATKGSSWIVSRDSSTQLTSVAVTPNNKQYANDNPVTIQIDIAQHALQTVNSYNALISSVSFL
eukprot:ANDGO_03060.mRNA.1 hypothetical protein